MRLRSPLVRRQCHIIQSDAVQQDRIVGMLPDGLQPRVISQEHETVRALRDGLIEQSHGALLVADA
jgi:hypothetical protein